MNDGQTISRGINERNSCARVRSSVIFRTDVIILPCIPYFAGAKGGAFRLLGFVVMFKCMFKHNIGGAGMVKTITIRDEVYEKLSAVKGKEESFSELFERLLEDVDSVKVLKKLRGSVEFVPREKEKLLGEIRQRRAERRS